ncbi:MAG: T9SS type A sorting domain-containing protein [Bacteroidota bacterium]
MLKTFLLSVFFTICLTITAQNPTCNGFRYLFQIFFEASKEENILYGQAMTPAGVMQDLFLDVYYPLGDTISDRPLIIFIHGGPFSGGSKEDVEEICRRYAERGYVTVGIDYRAFDLTLDANTTEGQFIDWLVKATADAKAAVRFMRESIINDDPYRISDENIFYAGISYGAVVALHAGIADPTDDVGAAYLEAIQNNGGWEGNSNTIDQSSSVQAIASFSGALIDTDWLDLTDPLIIAFHDENDPIIPFTNGFLAPDGTNDLIEMKGSSLIADRAESNGSIFQLELIEGSDEHLSYFDDSSHDVPSTDSTTSFYFDIHCNGILSDSFEELNDEIILYPNPTVDRVTVKSDDPIESITVVSISGEEVLRFSKTEVVDMSKLENGLYYLMLEFQNGQNPALQKIVKH